MNQHTKQTPLAAVSEAIDGLRAEITGGLLYTHHRANANTAKALETAAFASALIELLIEKGLLKQYEVNPELDKVFAKNGHAQ